jgi:hypothetical protein
MFDDTIGINFFFQIYLVLFVDSIFNGIHLHCFCHSYILISMYNSFSFHYGIETVIWFRKHIIWSIHSFILLRFMAFCQIFADCLVGYA